jgi:glycosyltransferase involved in cell wall biosynthesis
MNKVLDYMTFGRAQVMFDVKEGRVSAGLAAEYVPENSAAKLADAIDRVLRDQPRREAMASIGLERMNSELNWEHSVTQLLAAYRSLDEQGPGNF